MKKAILTTALFAFSTTLFASIPYISFYYVGSNS